MIEFATFSVRDKVFLVTAIQLRGYRGTRNHGLDIADLGQRIQAYAIRINQEPP
jgi:hypothetical protein